MKVLLNDSSVLLNLLAADCLPEIASTLSWQLAICPAVCDEVKKLRDPATGEMVTVDLTPLIANGLLHVMELAGEEEEILYVEQSMVVDDGEAMSIALAAHQALELAIDDKQASNHVLRVFPEIKLWTTPEILKKWAEEAGVVTYLIAETIHKIESRSRYSPPRSHPLFDWWHTVKSASSMG